MRYLMACYTDKGKIRTVNQDALFIRKAECGGHALAFAVICDGMGGLKKGEIASTKVISLFQEWFDKEFGTLAKQEEFEDALYDSWEALLKNAHEEIKSYGELHGVQVGTTATAALFWQGKYYIAHVGDCRIYEIKDQVSQLTKDQILAELKEEGEKKAGEHILLQGLGASKAVRPAYYSGKTQADAVYLLCTDGFRHKVGSRELYQAFAPGILTDEETMAGQGQSVARTVMDRGERDNLSVILIRTVSEA